MLGRAYRRYREDGLRGLTDSVQRRWRRRTRLWPGLGPFALPLARLLEPCQPPVVVMSLPRSGSSWVGATLGVAPNAMYLREPLTQGAMQTYVRRGTVFEVDAYAPPALYAELAERAFLGLPPRDRGIAVSPAQWSLRGRRQRRIVIKEVNPLACRWLLDRYEPFLVLLVRHPAAVALSYRRLGWEDLLSPEAWRAHGEYQGAAQRFALDAAAGYERKVFVEYEGLCLDALTGFRDLYRRAGLDWDDSVMEHVVRTTAAEDSINIHGNIRKSAAMADRWRGEILPHELEALRAGYARFELPWYAEEGQWSL